MPINREERNNPEEKQEVKNINLNYIFNMVQWIISSASQTGTIAHDFIRKNGEGDKLANLIYRDQEKANEAARIIG